MKRKSFIQKATTLAGGSLVASPLLAFTERKKPLRVAHLSDIHLKPGMEPEKGMAKALHHAQNLHPGVSFIINGGDAIMDALAADKQKTATQFDLFKTILKNENSLPVHHTIGNHDIWGWFIKENRPEDDPQYGKAWVVDTFEMKNRYYSFTQQKWHFIVLDSTQLNPAGGYIARLDEPQLEWFTKELESVPKDHFICLVSHIPILSICAGLYFEKTEANGDLMIKRNLMHTDFLSLRKIFANTPQLKCCISGHIHMQDELTYQGIKYYCNGAVCGNWWKGAFNNFEPAYALMEFYDDGRTKRTIINY